MPFFLVHQRAPVDPPRPLKRTHGVCDAVQGCLYVRVSAHVYNEVAICCWQMPCAACDNPLAHSSSPEPEITTLS